MTELMPLLSEISGMTEAYLWQVALVFLRVGAAVALFPGLGEQMVPQRVKLAVSLGITMLVAPAVAMPVAAPAGILQPLTIEAAAGLVLGFSLRVLILALQTAGTIAAQSSNLAQMFAGAGAEPQPIVSNLLILTGIAVFVAMGGLAQSVALLILSYELIPIGALPDATMLAEWGLGRISKSFALALSLAAPFVLAALLYNLALGAINRAMPQLMVSFIGAPALTLGALILLALSGPMILTVWQGALQSALAHPFKG
ncbi:flagellar biosynthetic protein FliR [Xinfangfangia sp. CPCC 101601]|uniref:Flagellar biosynthetic protein FliR n=1 Tax=Pseudogemmobacter lacusdianii TaxID=3069608 RepID=A0ABU0VU86_9RHOB|nr:flagellar biosynthetic protein FliR [Xinfangfangia sp. CPCC 101601]MDQ2065291.1 flagellar biosynthetic protein FliR [Xinfangfangia sp. CPCC 101601]